MVQQEFSTAHIEYVKKDFLDSLTGPAEIAPEHLYIPQNPRFLKISGIAKFWETKEGKVGPLRGFMEDIFSGLFEGRIPLIFSIFGTKDSIEIFMGTFGSESQNDAVNLEAVRTSLKGAFRGITLEESGAEYIQQKISGLPKCCCLTGQPGLKSTAEGTEIEQIERLIRGLYGKDWGYIVVGYPLKNSEINYLTNTLINLSQVISNQNRDGTSAVASVYGEVLGSFADKLTLGETIGLWHTAILLLGKDPETLTQIKTIARSVFGGKDSAPDRIRTVDLASTITAPALFLTPTPDPPGKMRYPYSFMNLTNSWDLSLFVHLPTQEMPGFEVRPYARFNVSLKTAEGDTAGIGEIMDQGASMGIPYAVAVRDLNKHGLIVGTTGSGKTNTIFHLLRELWKIRVPFLVLEPVKTEYRKLLMTGDLGSDLQVFTLGDNNVSPFRINPFEVLPGVPVQTHIELLKAVFNASFFMWGPLPHVLERCIHEIYTDKGWDLTSNRNPRGTHTSSQPTLTDLYNKVDEVVNMLGYSQETTMEIRGALKTRIDSMRLGGKGLMLDTRRTIPFNILMEKPTVLELEPIGDDEEKCFIMGLILTRMYEAYISSGLSEKKGLGHITVIEEAHRLLGNSKADNPYVANVKGKAVESFTNILAEIRAYGEGFLIADQIPTKLAPEIIKNTNLKVMHRVVAEDDRKIMGATMNMTDEESIRITALNPGEAAVFSEGDWGAYHLKIPYSKVEGKPGTGKDSDLVIQAMEGYRKNQKQLAPYEGCVRFCQAICQYKPIGSAISVKRRFSSQMPYLVLSLLENSGQLTTQMIQMWEAGSEEGRNAGDPRGVGICAIIQESERYFEWLGTRYQWQFSDIESLTDQFLGCYIGALTSYLDNPQKFSVESIDRSSIALFTESYRKLCAGKQPTTFCSEICPENFCQYRYHISEAVNDPYYQTQFTSIIKDGGEGMWQELAQVCSAAIREIVLPDGTDEITKRLGLCYALQKTYGVKGWSRRHARMVIDNLIAAGRGEELPADTGEFDVGEETGGESPVPPEGGLDHAG